MCYCFLVHFFWVRSYFVFFLRASPEQFVKPAHLIFLAFQVGFEPMSHGIWSDPSQRASQINLFPSKIMTKIVNAEHWFYFKRRNTYLQFEVARSPLLCTVPWAYVGEQQRVRPHVAAWGVRPVVGLENSRDGLRLSQSCAPRTAFCGQCQLGKGVYTRTYGSVELHRVAKRDKKPS